MHAITVVAALLVIALGSSTSEAQDASPHDAQGSIAGVVRDALGAPLADVRVQLQRSWRGGQPATTTDATGAFTLTGLHAGHYRIEVVRGRRVVARSVPIELSTGDMTVTGLVLRLSPTWTRSARKVAALPPTNAKRLLGTQSPATSLETLSTILKPGNQVVFQRDSASFLTSSFERAGRGSGGAATVAEISTDRLILLRRRLFRTEEIVFTEDTVRRIDIVDPRTQGTLIGASVGAALGLTLAAETHSYTATHECNLCPLNYMLAAVLPALGGVIGDMIDGVFTQPVYQRPSRDRRVTFAPLLGRESLGIAGRVTF
jgi:carboxypeptidase family protein